VNIDVTDNEHTFNQCRQPVEQITEFAEERRRNSLGARPVDDGDSTRGRAGCEATTGHIESAWSDADVDTGQLQSGSRDDGNASVVRLQRVSDSTWTGAINNAKAVSSKSTQTDRLWIVPGLDEAHDVYRLVASNFEKIVDLAGQRSDVEAAERDVVTSRD